MLARPLFIAGNWKMNPGTEAEAVALAEAVKAGVGQDHSVRVAICPPSVFLSRIDKEIENSPVGLGGQNLHFEASGAYTGELSGTMLIDSGCTHVILGHSERRHGMGETNELICKKLHSALSVGLIPILCIGETKEEREANQTEEIVTSQLLGSLDGIDGEVIASIVLAYEPVWAIGTGLTATPEQAQDVHRFIRGWLANRASEAIANRVTIQYGGSVKPSNADQLLAQPDIDGALVGGASLKAPDFLSIIEHGRSLAGRS